MEIRYLTLVAPFISWFLAQNLKPFTYFFRTGIWDWKQRSASGGLPSSHTSTVSSLCLAIGLREGFDSSLFALSLAFCCIVAYDAMNVRYFAGENIRVTKLLVDELSEIFPKLFSDDQRFERLKEVLGHTLVEVSAGFFLGLFVTGVLYLFVK